MSLTHKFHVHSAHMTSVHSKAVVDGEEMSAHVPTFEVELVGEHPHGSITLRFRGAKAEEAQAIFRADADVEATWG